jgi:hypothetical protein
MAFTFRDLDDSTRQQMIDEIDHDLHASGTLYESPRLSVEGRTNWPQLVREAAAGHDEVWLATQLQSSGALNQTETRQLKDKVITAKLPHNAHELLAEGEFNRLYIRGLCNRAIAEGRKLQIYRAKPVRDPRVESEGKIGQPVDAKALLSDLRAHIGVDTALGLPAGPNSGLSVHLN